MIDNYNYWNSLSKCIKMKIFLLFTIICSKINMLWKIFRLGSNLPTHIRVNTNFSRQKPQQLLSAEANFESCLMMKDCVTLILLLYCIKRESWLGMAILPFITKHHSCKTLKEVSKNVQLLSKNHFKIWYAPLICSDLGSSTDCYYHI